VKTGTTLHLYRPIFSFCHDKLCFCCSIMFVSCWTCCTNFHSFHNCRDLNPCPVPVPSTHSKCYYSSYSTEPTLTHQKLLPCLDPRLHRPP
jgi:hypothetical protein